MFKTIQKQHQNFPKSLLFLKDCPLELYYLGNLELLNNPNGIAVVGSRKSTEYGTRVVRDLIFGLQKKNVFTISGFMYGIDLLCHTYSFKFNISTVAVLPCGINFVHPKALQEIKQKIIDTGGLIISEYPGDFESKKWTFVRRNRLIAALCKYLLVIEAAKNSGSLITANLANNFNKQVYAVPGNIYSQNSEGIYEILNKYALLLNNIKGFCDSFNNTLSLEVLEIFNFIKGFKQGVFLENIFSQFDCLDFSKVLQSLAQLELCNLIYKKDQKFYVC